VIKTLISTLKSIWILVLPFLFLTCSQEQIPVYSKEINNLQTFGRLYGYVKYFYPGDEAANNDWDRFAVYGVQQVEKATNRAELKKILERLFTPLAPALVIHETEKQVEFSKKNIIPESTKDKKVITWQHLGVSCGSGQNRIYRSIRLFRKEKLSVSGAYFPISSKISAKACQGRKIKLKGAFKVDTGIAQMWLRVNRPNNQMGFFDSMRNRPITTGDWRYHEIRGEVSADAVEVVFGLFLNGPGTIWVDDFQIYAYDKTNSSWESITIDNPGFEKDEDRAWPQHWVSRPIPSYAVKVTAETAAKGKKSLAIKSLFESALITSPIFEPCANLGEHIAKDLGSGLSCLMPIALYGTETATYPQASEASIKALSSAIDEHVPTQLRSDNLYVRLAGVVISWNIFQHFYPYFDVVKTNWAKELPKTLASAYQDKTPQDFMRTLKKLTAKLKDGHSHVYLTGDQSYDYFPPIKAAIIEDQLVITEILDKTLTNIKKGDVITEMNGLATQQVMDREKQYISAASVGWLKSRMPRDLLSGSMGSKIHLKLQRGQQVQTCTLTRGIIRAVYYTSKERGDNFKKISEDIFYLNMDRIPMSEINNKLIQLQKAKAIICDMRGYPNANHRFISHLLKESDTTKDWMRVPRIIYPDYEKVTYQNHGWMMPTLKPHLTAKVIFIIDGRAISYAESFMGFIEHYNLATIVGQPTAGTNGNVNSFGIPGGYSITFTGMQVVKHDGSQFHGVGILPHIRIKRTIEGVREGRDEFLEKAIEIANK
jgi:C-terminal processing protease CtpA/Prc